MKKKIFTPMSFHGGGREVQNSFKEKRKESLLNGKKIDSRQRVYIKKKS